MKNLRAFVLCLFPIVLAGLAAEGCKKEPPVIPEPTLSLTAVDASCTEAWLKATTTQVPATVRLVQVTPTSQTKQTLRLISPDSLLIDEGLLPKQTYTYQLQKLAADSSVVETSTSAQVTTMDTTSHNWIFDPPVLLGDGSSSVLYDVAIVSTDPPLVYAVGELYLSGEPTRYNLAMWSGNHWNIQRVPYYYQGQPFYHPIQTVFAFAPDNIWFAGNGVVHWNGQQYIPIEIPSSVWGPNRINKIWGHNGEIWIVGDGGSIAHRSPAGTWQRLESGTTLRVQDICGAQNVAGGVQQIVAVAANKFTNNGVAVLGVHTSGVQNLSVVGLPTTSIVGVWSKNGRQYHVCGDGLYLSNNLRGGWREIVHGAPRIYMEAVRGTAPNDIIVAGDFGFLLHWNGARWREYSNNELPYFAGQYEAVDVKAGLMTAVGWLNNGRAIVLIGRR